MPSGGRREGAGRKPGYTPLTISKQRMRASRLMFMLYETAVGQREMTATQLKAATEFLRKVVPDLKSVEHTGEMTHRHVTELTDAELIAIAANRGAGIAAEAEGQTVN